ncbi:hypothetical protein Cni_G26725 [Canna indica]|uniref:DUF4216 domain-containing protein n=1 Tax=Canna indica TaxID=4628 RepID=A0AAQ3L2Q1_9LILI|nr:hypothetical protein Cni_G26725 [Canna indica]
MEVHVSKRNPTWCDWIDVEHGTRICIDEFGFPLVNFSKLIHTGKNLSDDPFVLVSQVQQVYYVHDALEENWWVPARVKSRNLIDDGSSLSFISEESFEEIEQHNIVASNASSDPAHDDPSLARDDVEHILIDTPIMLAAMRDERFDIELQNDDDDDDVGFDAVGS